MKNLFVILSLSLVTLSNCGKSSESSLKKDAKLEKLEKARAKFLLAQDMKLSLATALALMDLEREANRKIKADLTDARGKKAVTADIGTQIAVPALIASGAANAIVFILTTRGFYSDEHRDMLLRTKVSIRTGAGVATFGLFSSVWSHRVSFDYNRVKLTESDIADLSRQFKGLIENADFEVICEFLGLNHEDRKELALAFRKDIVKFFDRNWIDTAADLTASTFFMEVEKNVNFLRTAKSFTPTSSDKPDYQERLKVVEDLIAAVQTAEKLMDEKSKDFDGTNTVKARIKVLEDYKATLEADEMKMRTFSLARSYPGTKRKIDEHLKVLKELADLQVEASVK